MAILKLFLSSLKKELYIKIEPAIEILFLIHLNFFFTKKKFNVKIVISKILMHI